MHILSRAAALSVLSLIAVPAFAQGTPVAPQTCLGLLQNLSVGVRDTTESTQVARLQAYLIQAGTLSIGAPTGYFGALTRDAVAAFQKKEGLNAQGYVGPLTRARLTERSCPNAFTFMAVETPKHASIGEEIAYTVAYTVPASSTPLKVSAVWGDEPGPLVVSQIQPVASTNRIQYVRFTHTYEKTGTYPVEFRAEHGSQDPIYVRSYVTVE